MNGQNRFVSWIVCGLMTAALGCSRPAPPAPDGTKAGGEKKKIEEALPKYTLPAFKTTIHEVQVAFSSDGELVAAAGSGGQGARVWDLSTGKEIASWTIPAAGVLAFSPDGKILAIGGMKEVSL